MAENVLLRREADEASDDWAMAVNLFNRRIITEQTLDRAMQRSIRANEAWLKSLTPDN